MIDTVVLVVDNEEEKVRVKVHTIHMDMDVLVQELTTFAQEFRKESIKTTSLISTSTQSNFTETFANISSVQDMSELYAQRKLSTGQNCYLFDICDSLTLVFNAPVLSDKMTSVVVDFVHKMQKFIQLSMLTDVKLPDMILSTNIYIGKCTLRDDRNMLFYMNMRGAFDNITIELQKALPSKACAFVLRTENIVLFQRGIISPNCKLLFEYKYNTMNMTLEVYHHLVLTISTKFQQMLHTHEKQLSFLYDDLYKTSTMLIHHLKNYFQSITGLVENYSQLVRNYDKNKVEIDKTFEDLLTTTYWGSLLCHHKIIFEEVQNGTYILNQSMVNFQSFFKCLCGVRATFNIQKNLDTMFIDENLLSMVLHNLLSNACKFGSPHTRPHFIVKSNGNITISLFNKPGVDHRRFMKFKDSYAELFNVGFKMSSELKSNGLGLYTVKLCLQEKYLNGLISFDIHEHGTTATVMLKKYIPPSEVLPSNLSIVILDDSEGVRIMDKTLFEKIGAKVLGVYGRTRQEIQDFAKILQVMKPQPTIVMIDWTLSNPETGELFMTALPIIQECQKFYEGYIIVRSQSRTSKSQRAFYNSGASAFIKKSVKTVSSMTTALNIILQKKYKWEFQVELDEMKMGILKLWTIPENKEEEPKFKKNMQELHNIFMKQMKAYEEMCRKLVEDEPDSKAFYKDFWNVSHTLEGTAEILGLEKLQSALEQYNILEDDDIINPSIWIFFHSKIISILNQSMQVLTRFVNSL